MTSRISSLATLIFGVIAALYPANSSAATWSFSTVSSADQANLNADSGAWTYESNNNRWLNAAAISDTPLMANGAELDFARGLKITATGADNVRVDAKKGSLTLNKATAKITIPGLKAGDVVTIDAGSSSSSSARHLSATNLNVTSGFTDATARGKNTGTVIADGDVTVSASGGFYIYSIEAGTGEIGGGGGGESPATAGHSGKLDLNGKQAIISTTDGTVKYYNTTTLASIGIDKDKSTVTVTGKDETWTDEYAGNAKGISFTQPIAVAPEATVTNRGVNITKAAGWLESVYAEWEPVQDATSYKVYVKGGKHTDWTAIDRELVRDYGSYCRADMPGLAAGTYSMKIVPVVNGSANEESASEASGLDVTAHDRSGFAFLRNTGTAAYDGSGIGAYKENGELKDNATVIYVTAETAKTVTATIFHDKAYKEFTGLQAIMDALQKGTAKEPICVRIIGTIKDSDMDSFSSSAEGLQIKGKNSYSPVNVTVEGIGEDAAIWGFGILSRNCSSVEFRNFAIMLCMDDCLSLDTDNSHQWIHHMDFFYGNTGGDSDQAKGDGTVDLKGNSRYVTIAYNHFWDCGKTSLCGMKSESTEDYADYHHNWFDHSDSRHPRVRTITTHVWNNYYDGVAKYGVGATMGSSIFVENNFYRNTKDPMMISRQGTDATGSGTFSGEDGGVIKSYGNAYAEKGSSSNYNVRTHVAYPSDFDCYEATRRDEQVPASYVAKQGGTAYNNFDTDATLMHSYTAQPAIDVPATVTGYYGAGRLNKGDFQWNFNNTIEDANYGVITELKTALQNYKSKLVKIFNDTYVAQMPNSNFEKWWLNGKVWNCCAEGELAYWDTLNKSATTLGSSNVHPSDDTPTGTGLSACLETKFSGIGTIGKLAAGNIYVGNFIRTDGTNSVYSLGREWSARPTGLKGWFKYRPVEISHTTNGFEDLKGKMDSASMWIALVDSDEPFEVHTNPNSRQLFDPDGSYVVAYGKIEWQNEVTDWTEFNIKLDYKSTSRQPKYILCSASSSSLGEYFTGGNGSVLMIDDLELLYDY